MAPRPGGPRTQMDTRHPPFHRLADLAESKLGEADRAMAQQHVSGCARCSRDLEWLSHMIELMRTDRTEAAPLEVPRARSEEHTSELQSRLHLVCRLLLEKKKSDPIVTRRPHSNTPPRSRRSAPDWRPQLPPTGYRHDYVNRGTPTFRGLCIHHSAPHYRH